MNETIRTYELEGISVTLLPKQRYSAKFTSTSASIGFAFGAQSGVHSIASDIRQNFKARANTLAFLPEGCDVYSASDQGGEYLKVAFDNSNDCRFPEHPFNNILSPSAVHISSRIRYMLITKNTDMMELSWRISQLKSCLLQTQTQSYNRTLQNGLSASHLSQTLDLINEKLSDGMTVNELARSCQLSPGHFARAFKRSIGQAPHEFVMEQRLNLARKLILEKKEGLTEIAFRCGFSSHAHMSSSFQSKLGIAPSQLLDDK